MTIAAYRCRLQLTSAHTEDVAEERLLNVLALQLLVQDPAAHYTLHMGRLGVHLQPPYLHLKQGWNLQKKATEREAPDCCERGQEQVCPNT